jgi:hypothetical protein
VRNAALHAALESFTADAAARLSAETDNGAEIPFELVAEPGGRAPLYCYRPLTARFIGERLGLLTALSTYAPAARALSELEATEDYLRTRGERDVPSEPRRRADAALRVFLARVFAERSRLHFEPEWFEVAYTELELSLYEGRRTTTVIAPVLGLALDHAARELALGAGLSLVRGDSFPEAPAEAVWGESAEPHVLAVLTATQERSTSSPLTAARTAFRRLLSALRLYECGGYALGPLAWMRTDGGAWRPTPLGGSGRPRSITFLSAEQEDELRAFHNLIARRSPAGEVAWALARFEMGCERVVPFEALTDYLLALRALLEPEGPASGRLPGRLAAVCAQPPARAALAERTARAIELEHAVITGLGTGEEGADGLVGELAEHLRAILRDILCGHLDRDVRGVADEILAEAAAAI